MLKELTQKQENDLKKHVNTWLKFILESGKDLEVSEVRDLTNWLYKEAYKASGRTEKWVKDVIEGKFEPEIILSDSYQEQKKQIEEFEKFNETKFLEKGFGLGFESWVPFYEYFVKLKLANNKHFANYKKLVRSGIWSAVYTDTHVFYCKLPTKVLKDGERKLHSLKGPAVKWRNGDCNYFIHGVKFEKNLWKQLVDRTLSPKDIVKLTNIEQRMTGLSLYDPKQIMKDLGAKLIDESKRGNKLYSIPNMLQNRDAKCLVYKCKSTPRVYFTFVPSKMTKADEAMTTKFPGITEEDYANLKIEA